MILILVVAMASFWEGLTGETYGASFERAPLPRTELLAAAREHERGLAIQSAMDGNAASTVEKADGRADRHHESDEKKRKRIMSDEYINACLQGEHLTSAAYWQDNPDLVEKHPAEKCSHRLPSGLPCWSNLWANGKPELTSHLQAFMNMPRKRRSQTVYDELSPFSLHCPPLLDGSADPNGTPSWHFFIHDRMVCKPVYVMNNPIGSSTLDEKLKRYKDKRPTAHNSSEVGYADVSAPAFERQDWKAISVIGWYQYQGETIGDHMPDTDTTVLPVRDKKDEWKEFCASRTADQHVSYGYWCDVWKHAPELSRMRHARRTLNFQHCTICVNSNAAVATALKSGDPTEIALAKGKREAHHKEARGERLGYHSRRESSRDGSFFTSSSGSRSDRQKDACAMRPGKSKIS